MFGLSIAAPLAMPPTVTPLPTTTTSLRVRVGGHDRFGGGFARLGRAARPLRKGGDADA